jgi:hypothetical protein
LSRRTAPSWGKFNLRGIANGSAVLGYRVAGNVAGHGVATKTVDQLCREADDLRAEEPFDGVSVDDAHAFALARFRYVFGQTMTTHEFREFAYALPRAS